MTDEQKHMFTVLPGGTYVVARESVADLIEKAVFKYLDEKFSDRHAVEIKLTDSDGELSIILNVSDYELSFIERMQKKFDEQAKHSGWGPRFEHKIVD